MGNVQQKEVSKKQNNKQYGKSFQAGECLPQK